MMVEKKQIPIESLEYFASHIHSHFLNQRKKLVRKLLGLLLLSCGCNFPFSLSYERKKLEHNANLWDELGWHVSGDNMVSKNSTKRNSRRKLTWMYSYDSGPRGQVRGSDSQTNNLAAGPQQHVEVSSGARHLHAPTVMSFHSRS